MIPKRILKKLEQIERHQSEVKRLVAEVESEYGLEDMEDAQGWTWGMNVDHQGSVPTATANLAMLEIFLAMRPKGKP